MREGKIEVETAVDATIKQVWECYTLPEHITKWNFASEDWHCPWAENDLQVGGKYRARMETLEGSTGFDFEGVYEEILPHQRMVYTLNDGRQVETTFEKLDDKTRVIIEFDADLEYSQEQQKEGWQAILDNFKQYTESL